MMLTDTASRTFTHLHRFLVGSALSLALSLGGPAAAQVADTAPPGMLRLEPSPSQLADVRVAGWGTAFVVSPGYLVTNAHVATGTLRLRDPDSGQLYAATIVARDDNNDLALLHAAVPGAPLPLADITEPVVLKTRIFSVGYPDPAKWGISRKLAVGWVRTPASDDGADPLTLYLTALPGNSGSPVCNAKGQVIGVIKGGLTTPLIKNDVPDQSEPMPVAAPLAPVLALLIGQSLPYETYGLAGAIENVASAVAPSVYLVERTEPTARK